ncbi:MAG: hypothetical protein WBG05_16325, partial [Thermoanaerobaculia bacterium]
FRCWIQVELPPEDGNAARKLRCMAAPRCIRALRQGDVVTVLDGTRIAKNRLWGAGLHRFWLATRTQ